MWVSVSEAPHGRGATWLRGLWAVRLQCTTKEVLLGAIRDVSDRDGKDPFRWVNAEYGEGKFGTIDDAAHAIAEFQLGGHIVEAIPIHIDEPPTRGEG